MELSIRKIRRNEHFQTENLTREAFWNMYKPGCDEHLVLHQIRESISYVEELDVVAINENEIIGHIISSKAKVTDKQGTEKEVLCVGPVSVLPSFQNLGIGAKLMGHSISEAKKLGFKGMILFGNPDYYHRFGFRNAKEYGITTKDGQNFEPFMALELQESSLDNVKGKFFEDEAYTVREDDLIGFEKKFPPKEKGEPKINLTL